MALNGQIAIVTGSAKGLGKAFAEAILEVKFISRTRCVSVGPLFGEVLEFWLKKRG